MRISDWSSDVCSSDLPLLPFRWFNRFFDGVTRGYLACVRFMLRRAVLGVLLFAGLIGVTVLLFGRVPGSLVPNEDQGYGVGVRQLATAAALARTAGAMEEITGEMLKEDFVQGKIRKREGRGRRCSYGGNLVG